MTTDKNRPYQLKLTPEQKAEIRNVTGRDAETLELSVEELEERIAPSGIAKAVAGG